MLKSTFTIVRNTECEQCGEITDCFKHYEWVHEDNVPSCYWTVCGYCDYDTDPRGCETEENLQNLEMWTESAKTWVERVENA